MSDFLTQANELFPYTQSLRRDFHVHPELGFREVRTGGIVANELESLGIEVTDDGFTRINDQAKAIRVATEWRDLPAFTDLLVERLTASTDG